MYSYTIVDPRPASREAELKRLAATPNVLGIEVTVPELAAACGLGNLDPQHTGGDSTTAAIEEAVSCPLPPAGATLATVRADLDSLGSMAVLTLRSQGVEITGPVADRVALIADHDKNPPAATVEGEVTPLQALNLPVFNHRLPVADRVALVAEYLTTGSFTGQEEAVAQVRRDRAEQAKVADTVTLAAGGRIAVVESTSRFAVAAAYQHADVVVAVNPAFRFAGGEPHRKVTVCQARPGLVDLKAVFADLSAMEPGWGGSPTVGGSPQGVGSQVSTAQVVAVLEKHLL